MVNISKIKSKIGKIVIFVLLQTIGIVSFYFFYWLGEYVICFFCILYLLFPWILLEKVNIQFITRKIWRINCCMVCALFVLFVLTEFMIISYTPAQYTNKIQINNYRNDHRFLLRKRHGSKTEIFRIPEDYLRDFIYKIYLEKAIKKDPNYAEAHLKLLKIYYNTQRYEEVTDYYEEKLNDDLKKNKYIMQVQIKALDLLKRKNEEDELYNQYIEKFGDDDISFQYENFFE
ncbi:MAG: hypothetical protein BWY74_01501 [Firmicutes bacterium ADurb.Bin419]|nr:MAG: hypothetical protein BWY74_01501 [Firmicutes bacterium ADurb.Bin419]